MNCQEVRELLPLYAEGELDEGQRAAVAQHLASCGECRWRLALQQRLPRLLARLPTPEPALEANVARRVETAMAGGRRPWRRVALLTARGLAAVLTIVVLGSLAALVYWLGFSPEQRAGRPTTVAAISPAVVSTPKASPDLPRPPAVAQAPTAGRLAFVREGDIYLKDLPDGQELRLTQDGQNSEPKWSPSGEWLAYRKGEVVQVLRIPPIESRWPFEMKASAYAWAPDRDALAFVSDGALYVFEAGQAASRQLVAPQERGPGNGVSSCAWSPDGQWLAYANGRVLRAAQGGEPAQRYEFLGAIRPDGTEGHMLLDAGNPSTGSFVVAGWSPDSRQVLFWSNPSFSASIQADGLSLNAVPVTALTTDTVKQRVTLNKLVGMMLTHQDFLAVTPQYNSLAVTAGSGRESWTKKGIAVIDLNSGQSRQLTDASVAALSPSWSPDGQRIVYVSGPDVGPVGGGDPAKQAVNQRHIWTMNRDGSDKRQLSVEEQYRDERPLWSSNGAYILWGRWEGDVQQLWLMRQDGGDERKVADNLGAGKTPSPDIWFGFYGYVDWGRLYDWWQPSGNPVRSATPTTDSVPVPPTTSPALATCAAADCPAPGPTPTPLPTALPAATARPSAGLDNFHLAAFKRVVKATGKFDPTTAPDVYVVDDVAKVRAHVWGVSRVDLVLGIGASDRAAQASGVPDKDGNAEISLRLPQAGVLYVLQATAVLADQQAGFPAFQGSPDGNECVLPTPQALLVVGDLVGPYGSSNLPEPLAAVRNYTTNGDRGSSSSASLPGGQVPYAGTTSKRYSSITGLASSWAHMAPTACSASALPPASTLISKYLPARTDCTAPNPRLCRAPRMVSPWGSLTSGLSVTYTLARYTISSPPRPTAGSGR